MFVEFIILGGYGIFVWPAFLFTLVICLSLYLTTKKEFLKQEKIFIEVFKQSRAIKIEVNKNKENRKKVLSGTTI